jgi:CHRD domain
MRRISLLAALVSAVACGGSSNSSTFGATLVHGNEPNAATFNAPAPNAAGSALVQIADVNGSPAITYTLRATGLSSAPVNAHIHITPAGTAPAQGPVIVPFKFTAGATPNSVTVDDQATGFPPAGTKDPDDATQALTPARVVELIKAGRTYVNIHTANNTGGEIRGDLKAQ